jgi:hypothetical protein
MKKDPSILPGTHRTRVFVAGSYAGRTRPLLGDIAAAVGAAGFVPLVADEYQLLVDDYDIHDVTLSLLHACRLAVFELSRLSGALMEIERIADYGTQCLVLFSDRSGAGYLPSRMLDSFVKERRHQIRLVPYVRTTGAVAEARRWLLAMRRRSYAQDIV